MPDIANIIGMLDRDGALHLGEDANEYGSWTDPSDSSNVYAIDFGALGRDADNVEDMNVALNPRGVHVSTRVVDAVMSGPNRLRGRDNAVPGADVLGWYQPVHFFASNWGIFIRESALIDLARDLAPHFAPFMTRRTLNGHVAVLIRAAFAFVFLHEHYHHKIESLAIRLHIVERRPIYPAYMKFCSGVIAGTDDDIEEAVAGVDAFQRLDSAPYSSWFEKDERAAIKAWFYDLFQHSPPGYHVAAKLLDSPPEAARHAEDLLIARVQEAVLRPTRSFPGDFSTATYLTHSLFNVKQSLWSIVPIEGEPILPMLPGALPLATSKLERYILDQGWELVKGGRGSHAKYRRNGAEMIVLPHTKDVSHVVLSSTAQTLGLRKRDLVERAS
jgi:predicted RNA binding protein YcfA (HicA-like mRNA interferase family)